MFKPSKYVMGLLLCAPMLHPYAATDTPETSLLVMTRAQQAAVGIRTAMVQKTDAGVIMASAHVIPKTGQDITISAPYGGQVTQLLVGLGETVKAHQALGRFTSPQLAEARRQWQEAQLEFKNAQSALQRDEAMLEEGLIPAIRVQLTRSKYEVAQATFKARAAELNIAGIDPQANDSFASATLRAPMGGTVTQIYDRIGQRIEAGTPLFQVANDSELQLDIQLSNAKAALIRIGDVVELTSQQAKAKIINVSRAADSRQSAQARAVVLQRGLLQVGEWVHVSIQSQRKSPSDAPTWKIPAQSLTHIDNESFIFIAHEKGFLPQKVRVLSSNDESALIEASLHESTRLAVSGIVSLRSLLQKDE